MSALCFVEETKPLFLPKDEAGDGHDGKKIMSKDRMEQKIDRRRREFLSSVTFGGVCFLCSGALATLLSSCTPEDTNPVSSVPATSDPVIDVSKETALQNVGGAVKKRITSVNSGRTIIVVRTGTDSFVALSAQCTHQGTEVNLPSNNIIICSNHGSRFNAATGSVIRGPAGTALSIFPAVYDPNTNSVTIG